ncbi:MULTISPECIES: hypothetical protein [unclassified Streptomyces]|uniref:hypothetical protein n=1 Tax=unclassified Streptomyces TaxID=2593676 RepID=UPI002E105DFC|nr:MULTISPECIES: hypothetical protein [unclassified Streptomyces]WSR23310.1 hypothetical protein OG573_32075 [Streptomyces sp. NBC_01205]
MSEETADEVDPTTDADEAALDRALAADRSAAPPAHGATTSSSSPSIHPAAARRADGSPAARRQPESE